MEKYIVKCKDCISLPPLPSLQLNLNQKAFILLTVVLLLLFLSTPALAAVEGILAKGEDGRYYHYCYQDLIDSHITMFRGNSDGLYEDYIDKKPVALLDSINGYVDFNYAITQYALALFQGSAITIDQVTERADVKKAKMPGKIYYVSSEAGTLVRQEERFDSQGGADNSQNNPVKEDQQEVDAGNKVEEEKFTGEKDKSTGKKPIMGEPVVTLSQAQEWAVSKNSHQGFIDIAPLYWEYGKKSGIRPEVLYAQAAYETGYGHYNGQVPPEFNNWAGIKIAGSNGDEPEDHEKFASPEDGVRGHFNHMSAYVGLQPIGEPHGRYYSVKSIAWAGTVKYVEELSGKWAPSANYHETIVRMVGEMK